MLRRLVFLLAGLVALGLPAGASAEGACPNEALRRELGSSALPDCRAYEMVTPPETSNLEFFDMYVSRDGSRATFQAAAGLADARQATFGPYTATRTADGWQSTALFGPSSEHHTPILYNLLQEGQGFSGDFSRALITTNDSLLPSDSGGVEPQEGNPLDVYTHNADGSFFLDTGGALAGKKWDLIAGASDDLGHVVFDGNSYENVYESVEGGVPIQVNLQPNGSTATHAIAGSYRGYGGGERGSLSNAVSADGSKIFFESEYMENYENGLSEGTLWVRENGSTTVKIAEHAIFATATPDGGKVFFTTDESLAPGDTAGIDLYEYDLGSGVYTRISAGAMPDAHALATNVAISSDGSIIYFAAEGQLIAGKGTSGAYNIYVDDHGALKYVTGTSVPYWTLECGDLQTGGPMTGVCYRHQHFDLTQDGKHLAMLTEQALLPADTDSNADMYVYDLPTDTLSLASMGPIGGNGPFDIIRPEPSIISLAITTYHCLSRDGKMVFFSTAEALVPGDVNGQVDVYERDIATGTTSLISGGTGPFSSRVQDVSADGQDVTFLTSDTLIPQDLNEDRDVYDARVDGGFAPPLTREVCSGEECRGASSSDLALQAPASMAFSGAGNLTSPASPSVTVKPVKKKPVAKKRKGKAKKRKVRKKKAKGAGKSYKAAVNASAGRGR